VPRKYATDTFSSVVLFMVTDLIGDDFVLIGVKVSTQLYLRVFDIELRLRKMNFVGRKKQMA
jgi:hypothetical protein